MKRGLIISPSDLVSFCTELYSIEWNVASIIVNWVRPEAECRTYDYEWDDVETEIADQEGQADFDASDNYYLAYKAILAFMKAQDVTEFVMTQ